MRLRIVLPLEEPATPTEFPKLWRQMNAMVGGVNDPATKDICRLNYLPSTFSNEAGEPHAEFHKGKRISARDLAKFEPVKAVADNTSTAPAIPDVVTVKDLRDEAKRLRRSKRPGGSERGRLLLAIADGEPYATPGNRHNTMLQVTLCLDHAFPNADPQSLVQLMQRSLEAMEADDFDPAIERENAFNALVTAREKRLAHQEESRAAESAKTRREIAEARGDGKDHPYDNDDLALIADRQGCAVDDLEHRWIAYKHPHAFFLALNGYSHPVHYSDVPTAALRYLAPAHVALYVDSERGPRLKSTKELQEEYGSLISDITYDVSETFSTLNGTTLTLALAQRNTAIRPTFHQQIHDWLVLLGGSTSDKLLDWISVLTRLKEQCCAVYVVGPPGVGKSLLAGGLAKLWTKGIPTPMHEALGRFNARIAQMPFILADEHIASREAVLSSTEIRRLIGDSEFVVEQKYRDTAVLRGAVRVMLCANNDGLLDFKEDLNRYDIEALAKRFLYIMPSTAAGDALRKQTHAALAEWESHMIAEHALWLAENRQVEWRAENRFLVDGEVNSSLRKLVIGSHYPSLVSECLVQVVLANPNQRAPLSEFIKIGDGELLVNQHGVKRAYETFGDPHYHLSSRQIGHALSSLSHEPEPRFLKGPGGKRARFWRIDVETLLQWGDQHGYDRRELKNRIATPSVRPAELM